MNENISTHPVAVIVVDVWDKHWHAPTQQRLDEGFARGINAFCYAMRDRGAAIIHAPTSVTAGYPQLDIGVMREFEGVEAVPNILIPPDDERVPVFGGGDPPWTRQHQDVDILPADYVSDNAKSIFTLLRYMSTERVYLVGMHLELCIVHNPFGAYNLEHFGFNPVIVSDLCLPIGDRQEAEALVAGVGFRLMPSTHVLDNFDGN